MSSPSFVDFLAEKVISFSSKMRDDTLLPYGGTFLMSGGNSYSTNHMDPLRAVSIFNKENGVLDFDSSNAYFLSGLLNEVYGMSDSSNSQFHNSERPEYYFSRTKSGLISPHLLNLISNLNSYHLKNSLSPSNSILFGNLMNNLLNSYLDKQILKAEFENQNKSPVVVKNTSVAMKNNSPVIVKSISPMNEITMFLNINKSTEKAYLPEEECSEITTSLNINKPTDVTDLAVEKCSEIIMSLNISKPTEKTDLPDEKCNLSTNVKLNLKMARRKTKQISKRSKKRRRRQKSKLSHSNNATLLSDDDSDSNYQASSHVSFIAESPDFGCKISFQHDIHLPSSFVIPVESDSDDDSEWETYDEAGKCNSSSSTSDDEMGNCNSSSSTSEDVDSDSSTSCGTSPVKSSVFSFVVPVEDSADDDSDWDCEHGSFDAACDFEFTGLFLPAFCTPKAVPSSTDCNVSFSSEDETDEVSALRKVLREVNKNWDNLAVGDKKSKPTSKVTFAPDEDLVEVFPVEMCERKGEWEIYATERLRFKRKIEELEKVISPCLHPEHRTKVFKTLMECNL